MLFKIFLIGCFALLFHIFMLLDVITRETSAPLMGCAICGIAIITVIGFETFRDGIRNSGR